MSYWSLQYLLHDFGPWTLTKYLDNFWVLYLIQCASLLFEPQEYHDNIGDMDGPEEKERSQAKIQKFMSAFWLIELEWFIDSAK